MESLKEEIAVLTTLDNPYIVKYFETYDAKKYVYQVMEYIDGELLDSYIEVNTPEREYGERTVANVFS